MARYHKTKFKLWLKVNQRDPNMNYMFVTKPMTIENTVKRMEDASVSIGENGGSVKLIALTDNENQIMPRSWLGDVSKRMEKIV
jgi:hypothetical protein